MSVHFAGVAGAIAASQRRQSPSGCQEGALARRQPFRGRGSGNGVASEMLRQQRRFDQTC